MNSIVCLVGPSGVGKTSYARRLIEHCGYHKPSIVTTRERRQDDDQNYTYVGETKFLEMVREDKFIEWDSYNGYYYGTLKDSVLEIMDDPERGRCVLDLTPKGCLQVKQVLSDTRIIALLPDDMNWLRQRLLERRTNRTEDIEKRTRLLEEFMEEVKALHSEVIYCNYSPASWDSTFKELITFLGITIEEVNNG